MGILVVVLGFLGLALGGSPALHWDSTSCHLAGPIPGSPLRALSFLGKDVQGLALFHARWDGQGRLQACTWQDEPEVIAAFRDLCTHETTRASFTHTPGPELHRALTTLQRIFQGPDLCCREHDLCPQNLSPFQYGYGIRNYRFHTISHCDCDARFQQCLWNQRDSISNLVGMAFFNVLEIPCFVLEEQEACVEWYWWAVGRTTLCPSPASSPGPATTSPGTPATTLTPSSQSLAPASLDKSSTLGNSRDSRKAPSISAKPAPRLSTAQLGVSHPGLQGPQDGLKPWGSRRACRSFRGLDQCEHRIGPQETKFHLHNSAHEPLFHCSCTRRLARFLRLHGPPAGTSSLWELLGLSCFKLALPPDCAEAEGCPRDLRAIKVSARHLRRLQQRRPQVQETNTDEGQTWPLESPAVPTSFYGRCLQLTQAAWKASGPQNSWSQ